MNKIEELVERFKENSSGCATAYTDVQINNIVVNCISITKTWFDNNKKSKGESYKLVLYDSDGTEKETLHGLTPDNAANAILSIIAKNNGEYASAALVSYKFSNGSEMVINELGKMDIS